jgi:DNA-binding NarL/FixJ family response regulator
MNRSIFRSPGAGRSLERDDSCNGSEERRLFDLLSPRQLEVLRLVAEGYSTKQIALKLDISAKTVETHRAHLTERLDIHDVAGLVRYALKMGIVSIHQPPLGQANRPNPA